MSTASEGRSEREREEEEAVEQAVLYARDLASAQASRHVLSRRMAGHGKPKRKLLIADDDASMRLLVSATLASEDYEILEAGTGLEALRIVESELPDLVLLDVHMPEMNGLEACRRIRAMSGDRVVHIVMLTGAADPCEQDEGIRAGADRYLTKPFRPLQLIEVIEQTLGT